MNGNYHVISLFYRQGGNGLLFAGAMMVIAIPVLIPVKVDPALCRAGGQMCSAHAPGGFQLVKGTRSARVAQDGDEVEMAAILHEKLTINQGCSYVETLMWATWFVEHRLAAVLSQDGKLCGVAMGRPCQDLARVSTEEHFFERNGKILWVDAVLAPDGEGAALLWDVAHVVLGSLPRVAFTRGFTGEKTDFLRSYDAKIFQSRIGTIMERKA
jgi:hypothetical protein